MIQASGLRMPARGEGGKRNQLALQTHADKGSILAKEMKLGSTLTLLAIACASFFVADVAHEAFGHAGACVVLGGKTLSLSTTYEDCSIRSRWIDGAGPAAGLIVALLAWAWLRLARPRSQNMRVFLCLLFAFASFWNVGYMVFSGLLDRGDWKFVTEGLKPVAGWHAALVVLGVVLYVAAMRALGAALVRNFDHAGTGWRPQSFAVIALAGAAVLATAGAVFDPRGHAIILTDALPSALSSFGLVRAGFAVYRRRPGLRIATPTSPVWIAVGFVCAAIFVALLGPGLRF